MKKSRIIGFDPASYRNLGWSVVDIKTTKTKIVDFSCTAGTFVIQQSEEIWQSCWPIFVFVEAVILKEKPELVIVEKTSAFSGGFVTGQVSNCMGVIFAVCGKYGVDVSFVYPAHVKKIITGDGKARKTKIKKHIIDMLKTFGSENVQFDSDHAYDAVANIITYLKDTNIIK